MYTITITTEDSDLYKALKAEETTGKRFEMKVKRAKKNTEITITAADATALKAITSSVTRLCEIAEKVHDTR